MTQEEARRRIRLCIDRQQAGTIPNDWAGDEFVEVQGPHADRDGTEQVLVTTEAGAWLVCADGSLCRPAIS